MREVDGVDVAALGRVVGEGHVAVRALGHERHAVVHRLDVLVQRVLRRDGLAAQLALVGAFNAAQEVRF